MYIADLDQRKVSFDPAKVFVAPGAVIIGSVTIGDGSSIWFNTVIRGDVEQITIGCNTNVQDGSVLHADSGCQLIINDKVTIGHKAMLHGCQVGAGSLIGINAVVLNGASIGKNCIVGANSLVPENMKIPDNSLVIGTPARVVKTLNQAQIAQLAMSAKHYADNGRLFKTGLQPRNDLVEALDPST